MMPKSDRTRYVALAAALALFGAAQANPADTSPADQGSHIEAVWKTQQIAFEYYSYTTFYTCPSLHRRLQRMLVSVGASPDMRLQSYRCDDHSGAARFLFEIKSPVEATPENIRAMTTHDSTDELVAMVNGERLPTAEDVQRFPVVWKKVAFARDRYLRLSPGDCELVEQFRRQVLPKMSVHVLHDSVRCSPGHQGISPPRLTVSALVPVNADAPLTTSTQSSAW
jgi:hypothetical protein